MGNIKTVTIYYGPYREKVNRFPVSMYDKQSMDADIDRIEKWFQKTVVDQNKIFETLVEDKKLTDSLAEELFGRDVSFSMQTGEETKRELEELEEQDIDKKIKQIETELEEIENKLGVLFK
ncbi:MAG: hypothetical protein ACOC5T_02640 [Elusimicrobiota bacterium]